MGQESQTTKSLFDFLYLDNIKIRSFYAQLTGFGSISSVKANNAQNSSLLQEGVVGVNAVAKVDVKLNYTEAENQSSEKTYDAAPTMPREMINRLDELGFISRELGKKTAGNLVLLKGALSITDIETLKNLLEPTFCVAAEEEFKHLYGEKKKQAIKKKIDDSKPTVQLIKAIPYALEARLKVGKDMVWMTLNREEMVGNPHDINLKHGKVLFGEYYVLGVLDAIPNDDMNIDMDTGSFGDVILELSQSLKETMGRNENSYGITPIAIFRVILANE
ncbi:DUF6414 family protein [Moraxella sp. ZY200743]|uniref:DUF6414 family protein n=1 Tax=Moraxella sp. ZY200743 TaxID=2911970 RepID=UPI003D7DD153